MDGQTVIVFGVRRHQLPIGVKFGPVPHMEITRGNVGDP